jgi:16S rRNA (cytosine967-C5)-methyltransferase
VLRRRVDARWRIQKIDLEKLLVIQNQILEQAIKCLKPGGRLLYSTCSIDPEENIDLVTQFLKRHPTFSLEKSDQLLPFKDQSDGAFAALLRLNSSS